MKNVILASSLTSLGFMSVITYLFITGHICLTQPQTYERDYLTEVTERHR